MQILKVTGINWQELWMDQDKRETRKVKIGGGIR
jgi:hypothetical protein